ncbi:MAG: hypothetical protein Q3972_07435 [Corynebacterium sp.]|nr:hypothetical protein [Corynebacterium sp.]
MDSFENARQKLQFVLSEVLECAACLEELLAGDTSKVDHYELSLARHVANFLAVYAKPLVYEGFELIPTARIPESDKHFFSLRLYWEDLWPELLSATIEWMNEEPEAKPVADELFEIAREYHLLNTTSFDYAHIVDNY